MLVENVALADGVSPGTDDELGSAADELLADPPKLAFADDTVVVQPARAKVPAMRPIARIRLRHRGVTTSAYVELIPLAEGAASLEAIASWARNAVAAGVAPSSLQMRCSARVGASDTGIVTTLVRWAA